MALLLWLFMALIPFILGKGALCILYGNQPTQEMSPADSILTGALMIIGLAEAAHLGACLLGRSFSDCVIFFGIGVGVCLFAAVLILLIKRNKDKKNHILRRKKARERTKRALAGRYTKSRQIICVVFGILVMIQLISIITTQSVYLDGDMTLETVNSFLASDGIYQVNPMTGKAYTVGIPLRLKILCLPTFYAILCQMFGLDAGTVVLSVLPAFVLLGSYLAYSVLAKRLFAEDAVKRGLFLVLVALLFSAGDYMFGMDGFGVLHSGFRGVTIRAAVLLPYTLGLMLRKKYKLVLLCILAEACIVWTLYGLGACAAVAFGILCVQYALAWHAKHKAGKEGAL